MFYTSFADAGQASIPGSSNFLFFEAVSRSNMSWQRTGSPRARAPRGRTPVRSSIKVRKLPQGPPPPARGRGCDNGSLMCSGAHTCVQMQSRILMCFGAHKCVQMLSWILMCSGAHIRGLESNRTFIVAINVPGYKVISRHVTKH